MVDLDKSAAKKRPSPPGDDAAPLPKKRAAWEDTNTIFTNEKGGMNGYDKNQVKKVIYEMSKASSMTQLLISISP